MELLTAADPYLKRRDRALELLEAQPHASEMLMLYVALLDAWQPALARVRNDPPGSGGLASAAVREILPAVLDATQSAGPALLREAVLGRFHEADLEALVERWLAGVVEAVEQQVGLVALEAVPLLAGDLAGLAADADAGVGEESGSFDCHLRSPSNWA